MKAPLARKIDCIYLGSLGIATANIIDTLLCFAAKGAKAAF
jgi:hypothetical protein